MLKSFKGETTKALISRLWPSGALFLFGFFLILYAALGIVYFQQTAKQEELQEQITQIRSVVSKPLPPAQELQAEYERVNQALTPISAKEALDLIVEIAEESGIVLDPESGEFTIPPVDPPRTVKVGDTNYGVLSITSIRAQGDHDNVMAFINKLDDNEQMETMVLEGLQVSKVEFVPTDEEETRRAEFYEVQTAVMELMVANELTEIPNPMDFASGIATDLMGDNPDTLTTVEGFPDNTTSVADKGYQGEESPRNGYVLYQHDKIIATDNFTTVDYVNLAPLGAEYEYKTEYYYTCEADGTVRQFDGPDVTTATEYPHNEREARRRELYLISEAIQALMLDNDLDLISRPMNFVGGVATNLLGDDPDTKIKKEGFPDISTTVEGKGYTGEGFPRNGYVLYEHDKIVKSLLADGVDGSATTWTLSSDGGADFPSEYPFDVTCESEIARVTDRSGDILTVVRGVQGTSASPHLQDEVVTLRKFVTVDYLPFRTTSYYYTCERDGTVRQFDGPNVSTAKEYLNIDTVAVIDIEIYTKPVEEEEE